MPAERRANEQFARTLPLFHDYSVTEKIWRVNSPERGENRATDIDFTVEAEPVKGGSSVGKRESEWR